MLSIFETSDLHMWLAQGPPGASTKEPGPEMNPYTSPNEMSAVENGKDDDSPLNPDEHPHYDFVLRMVLWGESREKVFQRLSVNGVSETDADQLYKQARKDRIRTIRSDYSRKIMAGAGLIVAAVATFAACRFGLGFIPQILLYACVAALGVGAWKMIDGLSGYFMAPGKTGSVADDA